MQFKKTNPHPKGKKTSDCVVRAIAIAQNKTWEVVYKELCELGAKLYDMPNSKNVYTTYLQQHGYVKYPMPKHNNGKRYTVYELGRITSGTVVVQVARHLVTLIDGCVHDTWDCSSKSVYNYYRKV
jgi:hypothetical protein